jgi:hypothetical protein
MTSRERIKKPEPERTEPIRNWSMLFGSSGVAAPPSGEFVSQGVAMGYQVIDQYMRQGQKAARSLWAPNLGGNGAENGQQRPMEEMFRQASQLATLWLDFVGKVLPGSQGQPVPPAPVSAGPFWMGEDAAPKNAPPVPAPATEPRDAAPTAFSIEIESSRRAEVLVDVRQGSHGLPLRVHDLRAPDPEMPRLTGIVLESLPAENRIAVRIQVPDDLPAGVYSGMVLDERTNLPRGTLSVRIASR